MQVSEQVYPVRRSKRARIAAKSDHKCWYFGCKLSDATRTHDHVIPRSEGGPSNESNLVLACRECNNQKRNLSLEAYRKECGGVMFFGESINKHQPEPKRKKEDDACDGPKGGRVPDVQVDIKPEEKRPRYINGDPRHVYPPSGRGQQPK